MSEKEKKILWELDTGAIYLVVDPGRQRLILTRKGFMEAFFDEIELVEGKDALTMTFRLLLTKLGAPPDAAARPTFSDIVRFHDGIILPCALTEGNMPDVFTPLSGTRELSAYGDTVFTFQTVSLLQRFKDTMVETLTERAASAILRRVAKRGGYAVAKKALADYGWGELDGAMESMDGVLSSVFPLYGWGKSRTITGRTKEGRRIFFLKCWNIYEAEGVTSEAPSCIVHQSYLEGIGECLSQTYEQKATESREVTCRAKGDDYCAFFIVQKEPDEKAVDWKELEADWKELDKVPLKPHP
jgi:predicted hydrocarbon binding protein